MTLPLAAGHLVGLWEVASDYWIAKDQLFLERKAGGVSFYRPQDHPELPFEIAKLAEASDGEVVRFAKQWGYLGRLALAQARRTRILLRTEPMVELEPAFGGEPLEWIRRESRNIQVCVSLAEAHQNQDADAARAALIRFFAYESTPRRNWESILRFDFFVKDRPAEQAPIERALATIPLKVARLMLDHKINLGVSGIEPELEFGDEGPTVQFRFDAMLQIAYLHIARLLEENARIEHCEECGQPFRRKDGRQRFCSRGPFQSESRCAYNHRYKKKPRSEWRKGEKKGSVR